jgi:excinuclease UvrABC ATPase subunit
MGPEGGEGGGTLVGAGRPAQILKLKTHTAAALKEFLGSRKPLR